MACCYKFNYFFLHSHFLRRKIPFPLRRITVTATAGNSSCKFQSPKFLRSSRATISKGYCSVSLDSHGDGVVSATSSSAATFTPAISYGAAQPVQLGSVSNVGAAANGDSGNGRVMLIDGTSVIHRAYYKLLAKLHHGHLAHADGNGDWVLMIFSALSFYGSKCMVLEVLQFNCVPAYLCSSILGCYFMTATTAPRLQVDNGIKIFHYNGSLYFKKMFDKLYQADWKPESPSNFGDITELIKSLDSVKLEDKKPSGQGSKPTQASTKAPSANPTAQKPAAYRPPHAKTAAVIQAQLLGESSAETLSKNALRNKKKREKQKEKKAAADASS